MSISRLDQGYERRLKPAGGSKGLVERVVARVEHGLSLYKQDSDSLDEDFFEPLKPDLDALIKITEEMAGFTQSRSVLYEERLVKAARAIGICQGNMSAKQQQLDAANAAIADYNARAALDRSKVESLQREIDEINRKIAEIKRERERLAMFFWVPGYNWYLLGSTLVDLCQKREPILAGRLRDELQEKNSTEERLRAEHDKYDVLAKEKRVMEWTIRDLKDSRTVLEQNNKVYSARFVFLSEVLLFYRLLSTKIGNMKANLDLPQAIEMLYESRQLVQLNGEVRQVTLKAAVIHLGEDHDRYLERGPALAHGVRVSFKLLSFDEPLPSKCRLATVQEVTDNQDALFKAMPRWEIANLADGSVSGRSYNGHVSSQIRNNVGHKLGVKESPIGQPTIHN